VYCPFYTSEQEKKDEKGRRKEKKSEKKERSGREKILYVGVRRLLARAERCVESLVLIGMQTA